MRYINVFKSWKIYIITLVYFLAQLYINRNIYLLPSEKVGILLGSFLFILLIYSIGYGIVKIYKTIYKT